MIRTQLSSDLSVWAWSKAEARLLFREIWATDPYLQEGLTIQDGAVVLDVGANIGMWSMALMQRAQNLTIHAFEPAPPLHAICARNLLEQAQNHQVQIHPFALGSEVGKQILKLSPLATYTTTLDAQSVAAARRVARPKQWAEAMAEDAIALNIFGERGSQLFQSLSRSEWGRPLLLTTLFVTAAATEKLGQYRMKRFEVEVRPLGDWIRASGLDHIDMVKIDVEGAEETVLNGLDDGALERISQFAIEVHEVPGRLERLSKRLERAGFGVTRRAGQLKTHTLLGISTLYARRSSPSLT